MQKTNRGFDLFLDLNVFIPFNPNGNPWVNITKDDINKMYPNSTSVLSSTRMHLNKEQVAELIPYLQRFVDTGELGKVELVED